MLVLLENDLCFGFNVKKSGVKDDFYYTDWKKKVLLDDLKIPQLSRWISGEYTCYVSFN